ncbi:MAG TPA: acyl-CoA dehydrogenase family protein [Blastocatellia bacterium]|jgi:alkylation response protein AidB-like acyl-CoA dehydrogenase|nr:acyl-CoA dehydrogenase family protein [Blastocatellia bacterium]
MDFDLNKAQKLLQQSARDFFARELKPERVRELMATDTAYDDGLWRAMADQGWTGLIIPEDFGGLGLSLVDLIAVCEEMGRACLPGPFLSTLWAAALIDRASGEGQRKQYLEPIAAGDMKATVAMLEEDVDWSPEAVELRAEKEGREFRLSGRKEFVTDAEVADVIICVARGNDGLVLAPVQKGAKGMKIAATPGVDATRKLYSVEFENVVAHEADMLAFNTRPQGAIDSATNLAIVALCAEMLGGMQWTLETGVEYAKTRQQFGKPIGVYQAVQHQLADMFLMTESARSAVYYAAWAVSENDPSAKLAVSVAKACCSDAAREVGNRGAQVHGGIGFTWEHNLQLYYKRAKASEIMFGDPNYHREEIARKIVDGGED